jgi:DNA (cytosine-5)-methyltransferase 1
MPDKENFNCVVHTKPRYIVRRLTPTECARLQGFPDLWGHPDKKTDFTDEEYRFWLEVRNNHAAVNGRRTKEYTEKQMLSWYNKLHSDSTEYKLWGNGIALPCALYVMQGIANTLTGEN